MSADFFPAAPVAGNDAEVVVNLWYFTDQTGVILRIAARAYTLRGSDEEKLRLLRDLSASDFLMAKCIPVPSRFVLENPGHKPLQGAFPVQVIQNEYSTLFASLIDELEQELPEPIRSINGEMEKFRLRIPESYLHVLTCVFEGEDGSLVAQLSKH